MLGIVGEQLRSLEGRAEALDQEGDLHHIREQLTTATRLHSQGDAATALAAAEAAYAAARHSVHESERREAKLRQGRQRLVDSTRQIAQTLDQDLVQRYFKREALVARQVAGRLAERADQGYRSYAKLQIELDRDQRALEKLNDDVFTMDSQATVVQEQFREREARIAKIVGVLTEVCGTMTKEPVLTYKDPENRKSTRVVQCSFTSGQVDLHVPLDANQPFQLEGFGHSSNKNCELVFRRVAAKLNDETLAVNAHHDEQARSSPQLRTRAAQASHLEGMSNRLDRLREDIDRA
ncbi:MAG TPA: hypothetical protein PLV92_12660 [Pirellulaceae bacterium]|nr:hypothetical protein [Pirellulaceae bacterium]